MKTKQEMAANYAVCDYPILSDGPIAKEKELYFHNKIKAAFLAGYTAANQWVPVGKRLPEEGGSYLVYGRMTGDCPMNVMEAVYDRKRRLFSINWTKTKGVTHWMKLPEPPTN